MPGKMREGQSFHTSVSPDGSSSRDGVASSTFVRSSFPLDLDFDALVCAGRALPASARLRHLIVELQPRDAGYFGH
jgi:hypothetical protein